MLIHCETPKTAFKLEGQANLHGLTLFKHLKQQYFVQAGYLRRVQTHYQAFCFFLSFSLSQSFNNGKRVSGNRLFTKLLSLLFMLAAE